MVGRKAKTTAVPRVASMENWMAESKAAWRASNSVAMSAASMDESLVASTALHLAAPRAEKTVAMTAGLWVASKVYWMAVSMGGH